MTDGRIVAIPHGGLGTNHNQTTGLNHRLVSIPHGGLRTRWWRLRGGCITRSPSHTVGLEQGRWWVTVVLPPESPSHPVGSKNRTPPESIYADLEIVRSPSHTVGLEQGRWWVTVVLPPESPSHPVGSKNRTPPESIYADLEIVRSPSHTVGSEPAYKASKLQKRQGRHPTRWAWKKGA